MEDRIINTIDELKDDCYSVLGIRFEAKVRGLGEEITDVSKELIDARDFPDFNSDEYESLKDLGGISTWLIYDFDNEMAGLWSWDKIIKEIEVSNERVYLIAGDDSGMGEDPNEQVISNGIVVDILK